MMRCKLCSSPAEPGFVVCARHRALGAAASSRYYYRHYEKVKARQRAWAAANRPRLAAYRRELNQKKCAENPEAYLAERRAYEERHRERTRELCRARYKANPEKFRLYSRARRYGITVEVLVELLKRTECDLCGRAFGDKERMQHVDHDHESGRVRGVLCHRCNTMLGKLEESRELIAKFDAYLAKHKKARSA